MPFPFMPFEWIREEGTDPKDDVWNSFRMRDRGKIIPMEPRVLISTPSAEELFWDTMELISSVQERLRRESERN